MVCTVLHSFCHLLHQRWGGPPVLEVFAALRAGSIDVNLLMVFAAIGAAVIGDWSEGATLLFLFSLSGALEKYTLERTARSISKLIELRPDTALVLRNGAEMRVPIDAIELGEKVRILPGERLAIDGTVIEGATSIDQATITGESMPVDKVAGDPVFAGTLNLRGSVIAEVTRRASETKLAQIVATVQDAQDAKGHTDKFIQRWQAPYVIGVLLVSSATFAYYYFIVPPTIGASRFGASLYHAMVLLVAASPCAVVIATPAATLAGITRAAKLGVLFKAGAHLEKLAEITVLAIDKTGTITEGRPSVISIWSNNNASDNTILEMAAGVEQHSEHLFAQAVLQEAKTRGVAVPPSTAFESHTGLGVHAELAGVWTGIGKPALFDNHRINVPSAALAKSAEIYALGQSVLMIGDTNGNFGIIAIADKPRPESKSVLAATRKWGIQRIVILTGDHKDVADSIAKQVGADDVRAGLLPEGKVVEIARAEREYGPVAMLGDGVNDAPRAGGGRHWNRDGRSRNGRRARNRRHRADEERPARSDYRALDRTALARRNSPRLILRLHRHLAACARLRVQHSATLARRPRTRRQHRLYYLQRVVFVDRKNAGRVQVTAFVIYFLGN